MTTDFTPGPWQVDGRTVFALNGEGTNIFSAGIQGGHRDGARTSEEELVATANVIALAPEMLSMLGTILAEDIAQDAIDPQRGTGVDQDRIRELIAKARGEQHSVSA